jgi:hypothetical protein
VDALLAGSKDPGAIRTWSRLQRGQSEIPTAIPRTAEPTCQFQDSIYARKRGREEERERRMEKVSEAFSVESGDLCGEEMSKEGGIAQVGEALSTSFCMAGIPSRATRRDNQHLG